MATHDFDANSILVGSMDGKLGKIFLCTKTG
jgi:hypothetical protein